MKVLAVAYACDPRVGSEAGIGWNWVRQIASRYDCWVITRENNVERVKTWAQDQGLDRLHVIGFDLPPWMRFWKRGRRGALLYFYLWQLGTTRCARALDREHNFDVVHHLTFASSWIPSGLSPLNKPFVWGPVGQHPRVPDRFLLASDLKLRLAELVKSLVRRFLPACDPFMRRTLRSADCILSLGQEGRGKLRSVDDRPVESMLACGAPVPELAEDRWTRGGPFRVVYAGRLVDLKGVCLAVDAFARAAGTRGDMELHLAGDGPRRDWLERRARRLGIWSRVHFHGHLPQGDTLALMESADAFLFPSFEGAGMVVVEALARGCPVVCLDFGGPGQMVGDDRGLRVPLGTRDQTVAGLATAIASLHADEDLRLRLARGAHAWARRYATWDYKGTRLAEIYSMAMNRRRRAS